MSSLMHYNATGTLGSLPTIVPAQYLVSFDKTPASHGIRHDFGSIIASHDESYSLWNEKDTASAPLKSYVLDGNMNQITDELADEFSGKSINDFIIADFLSLNETTPKENLVVYQEGPFVSFVTRADLEKHAEPSFAGVSNLRVCGSSQVSEGNVSDTCQFWMESITVPVFLYKIVNSTNVDNGVNEHSAKRISHETDVVRREGKKWKGVPVGLLTLTQNVTAIDSNSTGTIVEEHMTDLKRKRRKRRIAFLVLSVFAIFAAFLFTQMLVQKYSDYRPIP